MGTQRMAEEKFGIEVLAGLACERGFRSPGPI